MFKQICLLKKWRDRLVTLLFQAQRRTNIYHLVRIWSIKLQETQTYNSSLQKAPPSDETRDKKINEPAAWETKHEVGNLWKKLLIGLLPNQIELVSRGAGGVQEPSWFAPCWKHQQSKPTELLCPPPPTNSRWFLSLFVMKPSRWFEFGVSSWGQTNLVWVTPPHTHTHTHTSCCNQLGFNLHRHTYMGWLHKAGGLGTPRD